VRKPKFFYGWWIVGAGFVCTFIYSGVGYYAFSLFLKPLQAEPGFDWSRGEISAAFTIFFGAIAIASPFIGEITDRYGPKKVISIGTLIMALGFGLLSLIQSLWHFYAAYAIAGVGMAGVGFIPISKTVSNWFSRRRGTALGIAMIGTGLGGVGLAPLIGAYLIPSFGWRYSYLALAVIIIVVIIPITLLVIKPKPQDMGLYPDGAKNAEAVKLPKAAAPTSDGWTRKMSLATTTFWLIAVAFASRSIGNTGIIEHQVPYLTDIGFNVTTAAAALGGVGIGSAIGKFGFGWLNDQLPAKYCSAISFVLTGAAIIVFMNISSATPMGIVWTYAILMGLGMGGWATNTAMLVSTNFGLASYGAIYGMLRLPTSLATASGPLIAGLIYDFRDSYRLFFVISLILHFVAIAAVLMVRRPKLRLESFS